MFFFINQDKVRILFSIHEHLQMPYSICRLIQLHASFDSDFDKHKFTYLSTNRMPQPTSKRNFIGSEIFCLA
jgi:hypothetical protein